MTSLTRKIQAYKNRIEKLDKEIEFLSEKITKYKEKFDTAYLKRNNYHRQIEKLNNERLAGYQRK